MLRYSPRRSRHANLRSFCRDSLAISAVEFALILPIMMTLLFGSVEMSAGMKASRKLTLAADNVAELLSQNGTGSVTYLDLQLARDSAMIVFPDVLADAKSQGIDWTADMQISMSGIAITPTVNGCTSSCSYQAKVAWTGGPNPRPCNVVLGTTGNSAALAPGVLPLDLVNPPFLVVVDVAYSFRPLFGVALTGTFPLKRAAYYAPRTVSNIKYTVVAGDTGIASACPGY